MTTCRVSKGVMAMAITTEQFSRDFGKNWGKSIDTAIRNFADVTAVEIQKRAPFATGALVRSISPVKNYHGDTPGWQIVSTVPYARRRNYENHLHPQTLHYVEQGTQIARRGDHKRWWRDLPA